MELIQTDTERRDNERLSGRFFTWHAYATLIIILSIILSGSVAWYMNKIIVEGTAIQRDGYHTAAEWRELISKD